MRFLFHAVRDDVTYTAEACSDLMSWSTTGLRVEANGTARTVTVPASPSRRALFFRVRVNQP